MKNNNLEYRIQNIGFKQKLLSPKFYQLNSSKTVGFTLVELIVVIVILAILGTIAFISFQGYSRNSRDGVRIADINSVKKSLEIFITKAGFYPNPDNGVNITYSGAIVWTEGTLGSNVTKNIQSVSKLITDPLTSNEYTYSITSSKTEYQIGAISEGGGLTGNIPTHKTYAADLSKSSAVAYISGNYNEKFTKVNTGTTSWILAQPSIIATDIGNPDLGNLLSNKRISYNNYGNYPHSYNQNSTGGFDYNKPTQIVYSGSLLDLHELDSKKLEFITNLQNSYSGTILATDPIYEEIMDANPTTDSSGAINVVNSYINSNKGGIKLKQVVLIGDTSANGESGGGNGGGGTDDYVSCTGTGQILSATSIYGETNIYGLCDTPNILICSGVGTGYILAACNIGTHTASTGSDSYGIYYQFGRIDSTWLSGSISYNYDRKSPGGIDAGSANERGVLESNKNTATWSNSDSSSRAKMQGPCDDGYHIPTTKEWGEIQKAGGWANEGDTTEMLEALYIPKSGSENWDDNGNYSVNSYAKLWSSSPSGDFGGAIVFEYNYGTDYIWSSTTEARANGITIRCLKNE